MREENIPLAEHLRRQSHRIATLIMNSDLDWIDIAIEVDRMRETCLSEAPEKAELFEAVYVSRFNRLWSQWRGPDGERPDGLEEPAKWGEFRI